MFIVTCISQNTNLIKCLNSILDEVEIVAHIGIIRNIYRNYFEWNFKREKEEEVVIIDSEVGIKNVQELYQADVVHTILIALFSGISEIEVFLNVSIYRYVEKQKLNNLKAILLEIYEKELVKKEPFLELKSVRKYKKLRQKDIIYITREGKNIVVHTREFDTYYRLTLIKIYQMLDSQIFEYIDKGCIVNITYIQSVTKEKIMLSSGIELPISRDGLKRIKKILQNHCICNNL